MKLSITSLVLFLCLSSTILAQDRFSVTVTKVSDGDTFWATDTKGENIKFRPIGFNCPEESNFGKPAEPYNEEATAYTDSMIMDKTIYVEYDVQKTDKWGRHLVYVYLEDGRMLNEEILKDGWAELATYPPNVKYVERFKDAYRNARVSEQGMWKESINN